VWQHRRPLHRNIHIWVDRTPQELRGRPHVNKQHKSGHTWSLAKSTAMSVCLYVCIHIHIIYTKRFAVQQRQRQEGAQITETLKFGTGSSISLECSAKIMARKTHYSNMGRPHSSRTEGEAACKQTAQVWSHRVTCQEHCNVCLSVCLSVCMYVCTCIRYVPRDLQ